MKDDHAPYTYSDIDRDESGLLTDFRVLDDKAKRAVLKRASALADQAMNPKPRSKKKKLK